MSSLRRLRGLLSTRAVGVASLVLVVAQVALVLVSWLLSATAMAGVRSLLSSEGVRWFFGHFTGWLASPPLAWLLLLAMAVGALSRSGLLDARRSDYRQRMGLLLALVVLLAYVAVLLALTAIPHAVLLGATGRLFPSPFSRALVPVASFGAIVVSVCYGWASGTLSSLSDVVDSLTFGIRRAAPCFLLYILLIQFCESLRFVFA